MKTALNRPEPSTIRERLYDVIQAEPGQTERQLSVRLFGEAAGAGRLSFWCHVLLSRGMITRTGTGGRGEPFRYVPANDDRHLSSETSIVAKPLSILHVDSAPTGR